jgi:DNA-directed RNA polymerase subunit M/transcription elongation factor TFIIS
MVRGVQMDEKIKTLESRVATLEKELKYALDRGDKNRIHCRQCGSVKIKLSNPTLDSTNVPLSYDIECEECQFKEKRLVNSNPI